MQAPQDSFLLHIAQGATGYGALPSSPSVSALHYGCGTVLVYDQGNGEVLDSALEHHRAAVLGTVAASPVRVTLSKQLHFEEAPGGSSC